MKERQKITWNPFPCQIRKSYHIIMVVSNLPWSPSVSLGEQLSFLREIIVYVVPCGYIMEKKNFLKRFIFPLRLGKCSIGKEDPERVLWYKKCSESWYLWGLEPYWELPWSRHILFLSVHSTVPYITCAVFELSGYKFLEEKVWSKASNSCKDINRLDSGTINECLLLDTSEAHDHSLSLVLWPLPCLLPHKEGRPGEHDRQHTVKLKVLASDTNNAMKRS